MPAGSLPFPIISNPVSSVIYARRHVWIPDDSAPSDYPSFGTGHYSADLLWYKHLGYQDGSYSWEGARRVGTEWNFKEVFPGRPGKLYAIENDDDLLWYNHVGRATGAASWAGPNVIGTGWRVQTLNPSSESFLGVFCDTRNGASLVVADRTAVIYAVQKDGLLLWYKHEGGIDGSASWANGGAPIVVGEGWVQGSKRVFSGCNGIIYLLADDGTLKWYRHVGFWDGTLEWEGPNVVGQGWGNFLNVFSIGLGIIYAIDQDGTLWWYKHNGYRDGSSDWEDRKKVGDGWNANGFYVVCNSVLLEWTHVG